MLRSLVYRRKASSSSYITFMGVPVRDRRGRSTDMNQLFNNVHPIYRVYAARLIFFRGWSLQRAIRTACRREHTVERQWNLLSDGERGEAERWSRCDGCEREGDYDSCSCGSESDDSSDSEIRAVEEMSDVDGMAVAIVDAVLDAIEDGSLGGEWEAADDGVREEAERAVMRMVVRRAMETWVGEPEC
ncbi:hypothetical protein BU24DRAFT_472639 [Aaosphaeria arxii CBS 175.79]|uniref:Uncharacterized protein n=1 Tax=Aaosphaeria arxii CBS 175.79 TaxID=1450172 RepID=A0A6A5XCD2_9PLEO|nr:uncharacterized protein BU24DRAFT_472639 [Aaosphaeria arxii CBS 175.79]KAF2010467.1 hypothetical protein BU24DRAFT_472639 [Aaosphaeria arxii CBS 175.79]